MKLQPIPALLALVLLACGEPVRSPPDATHTTPDAGEHEDAGHPEPDAGTLDPICEAFVQKQLPPMPITNGSRSPTLLALTPGQQLAVGALLFESWGGGWTNGCTGTLVAPDVVITAAHCVWDWRRAIPASDVRFGLGDDAETPLRTFTVTSVDVPPDYASSSDEADHDVAILRLAESATTAVPELVPIPVNRSALTSSLVGTRVQVVGFGETSSRGSGNSLRYWTDVDIDSVGSMEITIDGNGTSTVCYGDSGGPLLHQFPDGVVRTLGTLSWGDPSCLDVDHYARLDQNLAWVEGITGPLLEPEAGCGSITADGSCSGTHRTWCEDDQPKTEDCASIGGLCEIVNGRATCVDDPCDGHDFQGTCVDGTAIWCEDDTLREFDCRGCGWSCAWLGDGLGFGCRVQ